MCGNAGWLDRAGDDECTHCRLVVTRGAVLAQVAEDIARRLAAGTVDPVAAPPGAWRLDPAGLRNVAWRFGYVLRAIASQAGWPPDGSPARGIATPAVAQRDAVTLGMMVRADDAAAAVALVEAIGGHFARAVVLLDGPDALAASVAARLPNALVAARPLNGDFAAQRNRVQDMAGGGWVLQIDTDERPDALLLDSLGWLIAEATRDGLRSLGLARRNIVDGALSALFPDIQYRLNHASVRYAGAVHERPVTRFAETSLALCGALEHTLDGERVRARTRIYEAMSSGAGRPEDEDQLLKPFDPIAVR